MGRRAAVVIGVNRTGGLTPLRAAVSDARGMAAWLEREFFDVTLLVDDEAAVTVSDVKKAVKTYVELQVFEQLVVYFAGHGCSNASEGIWLLSGVPADPNEAIDVAQNVELARACGIPSVVMISDACRTIPSSLLENRIRGSAIFPNWLGTACDVEVDRYFATQPGDPALEMAFADGNNGYAGLFTRMLRDAHRDPEAGLVQSIEIGGRRMDVVPSRRLKKILPARVTAAAEIKEIMLRQVPQLRLECGEETFIARAEFTNGQPYAGEAPPPDAFGFGFTPAGAEVESEPPLEPGTIVFSRDIRAALASDPVFRAAMDIVAGADATGRFETHTGIQVTGARVMWAHAIGMQAERVSDSLVRLHGMSLFSIPARPGSVILQFDDGTGTVVAGLPGYIAAIAVEDGRVVNISYIPSTNSPLWHEYEIEREKVEKLRAIAAAAARNGLLAGDREDARRLANQVRQLKRLDPTLGLYACLAYASFGLRADITSVLDYMRGDIHADLFDIILLAGDLENVPDGTAFRAKPSYGTVQFPVAPFCPMLAQSWSFLEPRGVLLSPSLAEAGIHRRTALWTTFEADGMAILRRAIDDGVPL